MKVTLRSYTVVSVVVTAGLLTKVWTEHEQFYPTLEHVGKSKLFSLVLGNLLLSLMLSFGQLVIYLFLGTLRDREIEVLSDRLWPTVTDTLLAMTIFRNEFTPKFIFLFTVLLGIKTFHWLVKDRVAFLATTPASSSAENLRIFCLIAALLVVDSTLAYKIGENFWIKGPSVSLLFLFEYVLLFFDASSVLTKFFFNLYDSWKGGLWEDKSVYVLYLEFFVDVLSLVCYLIFFFSIWAYYGLPIHLIRQIYYTMRHFFERFASVLRYQKAARELERLPNANFDDLEGADNICAICRDPMVSGKKLNCGHVFHYHCLRSWFLRRQVCPICRAPIFTEPEAGNAGEEQNQLPLPPPPFGGFYNNFPGVNMPNAPPGFLPRPPNMAQLQAHNHANHAHPHGQHDHNFHPAEEQEQVENEDESVGPDTSIIENQGQATETSSPQVTPDVLERTIVQVVEIQEQLQNLTEQVGSLMTTLTVAAQQAQRAQQAMQAQEQNDQESRDEDSPVMHIPSTSSPPVSPAPFFSASSPRPQKFLKEKNAEEIQAEEKEQDEEDSTEEKDNDQKKKDEMRQARMMRFSQDSTTLE